MSLPFSESLNIKLEENVELARYTTFQLGGPCRGVIHCRMPSQLENAVRQLASQHIPFILIGGGSNLVVSDKGLDCFVIRYYSDEPLIELQNNELKVSGSTLLDTLAAFCAQHGLSGINYCSGIPGTVGGAIVGNAGAFGKQIGDVTIQVELITRTGQRKTVSPGALGFRYRHSALKESDDIVLSMCIRVKPDDAEALLTERGEILKTRSEKHPDLRTHPCAGSFFRNIEPSSSAGKRQAAGWFLDQAGGKRLSVGGAAIFDKHANIIVKSKGCSSQDVYELSKKMTALVKKKFGLELTREVRFVGEFDTAERQKSLMW